MSKKKHRSGIADHSHKGKTLVAPMNQMPTPLEFARWGEERLAELLWGALLVSKLPRGKHLWDAYREMVEVGAQFRNLPPESLEKFDLSITGMAVNKEPILEQVVAVLAKYSGPTHVLRPLLSLKCLPNHERWQAAIGQAAAKEDLEVLAEAVGQCLFHQSQAATDLRYLTCCFEIALGRIYLPRGVPAVEEFIETMDGYPRHTEDELRNSRPHVRSMEGALRRTKYCKTEFTDKFWAEVHERTSCVGVSQPQQTSMTCIQLNQFESLRLAISTEYLKHLKTTAVDPRLDTVFGAGLYGLRCLSELCSSDTIRRGISGKALLRAILELRINLAYLLKLDSDELWSKYRKYGASQAKLALLKLDLAEGRPPSSLSEETLEGIASEDLYQEFVDIPLGSWSGEDLRKLSEKSGTKGDYDKFYGWAATFVHSHWCAMRDSEFTTCLNPLHRLHRVPRLVSRPLEDALPDAIELFNHILVLIENGYGVKFELLQLSETTL